MVVRPSTSAVARWVIEAELRRLCDRLTGQMMTQWNLIVFFYKLGVSKIFFCKEINININTGKNYILKYTDQA